MPRSDNKYASRATPFTFIDLFAGIGGFHLALHDLKGTCVYASEWDKHARKTYQFNLAKICPELFEKDLFRGDITLEENQKIIPENADILCAGFPCQPFSQAGSQKGFAETRGTLFFEIAKIINDKRPKAIFLENVGNLLKHDQGKTFSTICTILEKELGYTIFYKILKASSYGLPTRRPRLYIVGFREDIADKNNFSFPEPVKLKYTMSNILNGKCEKKVGYTLRVGGRFSGICDKRNWDAYNVDGQVHFITPHEGKKMMGFPDWFTFPVSDSRALRQLGNSVALDPVRMTAKKILAVLGLG